MDYIKVDNKTGGKYIEDYRKLTLEYSISVGGLEKYFEGLKNGVLYASKCESCGSIYYPPRSSCGKCGSSDIEWIELGKEGTLLTFTEINVKPATHSHYDDYIIGIGSFNGVKVLGLVEAKYDELKIGMKIRYEIVVREPENYYIIVFTPI